MEKELLIIDMDDSFKYKSFELLLELRKKFNNNKIIPFKKIEVLVESIELYRPKSKVREEKKNVLEYLRNLLNINKDDINVNEVLKLNVFI